MPTGNWIKSLFYIYETCSLIQSWFTIRCTAEGDVEWCWGGFLLPFSGSQLGVSQSKSLLVNRSPVETRLLFSRQDLNYFLSCAVIWSQASNLGESERLAKGPNRGKVPPALGTINQWWSGTFHNLLKIHLSFFCGIIAEFSLWVTYRRKWRILIDPHLTAQVNVSWSQSKPVSIIQLHTFLSQTSPHTRYEEDIFMLSTSVSLLCKSWVT